MMCGAMANTRTFALPEVSKNRIAERKLGTRAESSLKFASPRPRMTQYLLQLKEWIWMTIDRRGFLSTSASALVLGNVGLKNLSKLEPSSDGPEPELERFAAREVTVYT